MIAIVHDFISNTKQLLLNLRNDSNKLIDFLLVCPVFTNNEGKKRTQISNSCML